MSDSIKSLVDRGLEIRREMKTLKAELDKIEAQLEKLGYDGDHKELKDADREGRRWLARGSSKIIPVVFTADKIIQSFKEGSAQHKKIEAAANGRLRDFYVPATTYEWLFKDGKQFRATADKILGEEFGPSFITACLARDKFRVPKSDVKIGWDDAEEIEVKK